MSVRIMVGDCLYRLRDMPDESVHCVITSPPYWGLRSYKGDPGMIGLEPTFDEHLENLVAVFREVRRVLRSDGTCWLNYGDAYSGSWGAQSRGADNNGTSTLSGWQIHAAPKGTHTGSSKRTGLKPKDLMMMPARVALALQSDGAADYKAMQTISRVRDELLDHYMDTDEEIPGRVLALLGRLNDEYAQAKGDSWWLRSEIIWHKPNPMPESCSDRPTSAHEKVFLLTKSARYFYDADAVRTAFSGETKALSFETMDYKRRDKYKTPDGWDTGEGAHGSVHRDGREKGKVRGHEREHEGSRDKWDGMSKADQQAGGANLRNVWKIATHAYSEAHFATFPPDLVVPCIKAGTSEKGCCSKCGAPLVRDVAVEYSKRRPNAVTGRVDGGDCGWSGSPQLNKHVTTTGWTATCEHFAEVEPCTVMDPFCGAGTVGLVAQRLQRNAIIIEISKEYAEMSQKRIAEDQPLFADVTVE